jgi:immune inhibitor A
MIVRTVLLLLAAVLAAGPARAIPPTPAALAAATTDDERRLLTFEPFATEPPEELFSGIAPRLAAGDDVTLRMVVLLADFSDRPATGSLLDLDELHDRLFSRGTRPGGSLTDYYLENSGGRLRLEGEIRGWYRMPQRYDTYVGGQAGLGFFPFNSQGLARDVVRAADADINYAVFDNDGPDGVADTIDDDRTVDLLLVVHSGAGTVGSSTPSELRAVAWNIPEPVSVDGVRVTPFAICPHGGQLGVFAHETGHLLGLPDLYDLTGNSFGLGTWSLMAGGWSLDGGRTPAHLDAWSKVRLGIVPVVNVTGAIEDRVVDPVNTGGPVFRLAPGGPAAFEYFLVENRQPVGFDRFLPGGGFLVYHVDELRPTNNIRTNYKVALEQPDGLYGLENLLSMPSFGDTGDIYTGETPSGGFGRFTTPDSRTYGGTETGVALYRIAGPDAEGRMTGSFRAARGPVARLGAVDVAVVEGDDDRFFEAGELIEIRPEILVEGGPVTDVVLRATSIDPRLLLESDRLEPGTLAPGSHAGELTFRARLVGDIPTNPYGLPLDLRVDFREEVPSRTTLTVGAGDIEGLEADFQDDRAGFTSGRLRASRYDVWRYELSGGLGGGRAWHAGNATGGYRGEADAGLTSPLLLLPEGARLTLDHLVDIAPDDSGRVVAGGFVEISVNGGAWRTITPTRGYDLRYFSNDALLSGRDVFTGTRPSWESLDFDLSAYEGSAILRFRFFSTTSSFTGLGWWIDNVRVASSSTPVRLLDLTAARAADGVRLSWRLDPDDLPAAVGVERRSDVGVDWTPLARLPGTGTGAFHDAAPPPGGLAYRLIATTREGELRELGRIAVPADAAGPVPLRLAVDPNPTAGPAVISFDLGARERVRILLFDAQGRRRARLLDDVRDAGTHRLTWDGRGDGGARLPGGLYFARIETATEAKTARLVVFP